MLSELHCQVTVPYLCFGALGGIVSILILHHQYFECPHIDKKDGVWRFYYGSVRLLLISMIAGCVGDKSPSNAFMWGLGGMFIMQFLFELMSNRKKARKGG